jgi:anti-sigma regulatory factor (Ser/Thr protein kinase)
MRHDVLIYDTDDAYAARAGAFLAGAVHAGQPAVAVTGPACHALLGAALGAASEHVAFIDRDGFYTRPEAALAGYDASLRRLMRDGAREVRLTGELPRLDGSADRDAWVAYEAILNRAFAHQPVSVLCTYDERVLPAELVDAARRTHPHVLAESRRPNPRFEPPEDIVRSRAPAPRPVPPDALTDLAVGGDPRALRESLGAVMASAGVGAYATANLLVAAGELLVNAERHGGGARSVRAGAVGDGFVCELSDAGPGLDDPLAGYLPPRAGTHAGAGLWVARQLTQRLDLVPSGDGGLTARAWV